MSISKLEIINSVVSILHETHAASKGSMGKLLGDKAELVLLELSKGSLASSNQPGFDLIGKGFIKELPQDTELKYEIKLRRSSVTSCDFKRSKIGNFDVGIIIWYSPVTLKAEQAFAIMSNTIEELCNNERAHVTKKVCRENGFNITNLLNKYW